MRRRQLLTASAIAVAGLAGCTGGDSTNEADGGADSGLEATVENFYATLYGEDDIEGANELYHPDSDAPEAVASDFEPYGGLENIQADLATTDVISEGETMAEVHATVRYNTPVGSATNTDWFVLRTNDDEWLVEFFLPESTRSSMSDEEVAAAMDQAMNQSS